MFKTFSAAAILFLTAEAVRLEPTKGVDADMQLPMDGKKMPKLKEDAKKPKCDMEMDPENLNVDELKEKK